MVTIRKLEKDEYGQLAEHPALAETGAPPPLQSAVFVGEDDGKVIAFCIAQLIPHVEPIYVDPAYRGTGLAMQLWTQAKLALSALGIRWFISCTKEPKIAQHMVKDYGYDPEPFAAFIYKDMKWDS